MTTITKEKEVKLKSMMLTDKYDRKFINELLFSIYTIDEIAERSVTGAANRNPHLANITKKRMTPTKIQFIYGNFFYLLTII